MGVKLIKPMGGRRTDQMHRPENRDPKIATKSDRRAIKPGLGAARVRRILEINPVAERQARFLAADNRKVSPDITRVLWFPNNNEVRLVEFTEEVPVYMEKKLHPFYFRASPRDELPLPTAVVLIRPNEIRKFKPPAGWGSWTDSLEL